MNTPSSMASSPPLLREWSYTGPPHDPPVAPAVVVEEEESPSRPQKSTPPTYPVATFVSNFVRNSIDHIYTGIAETIDDTQQEQPTLSVRSEDMGVSRRLTFSEEYNRSARSAPVATFEAEFDEADFVIIDGDLVAIPAPAPNEAEMEEIEYQSRRGGRRNLRGLRKWFKKRTSWRQECKKENQESDQSPRRNRRRSRRQSRRDDEPEAAPPVPPMAPITEVHASMSSAVSADFIGNVFEAGVLPAEAYIEPDEKVDHTAPTVQAEKVDVDSMLYLAREEAHLEQSMDTVMDSSTVKSMLNDLETSSKPQAKGEGCPLSCASLSDEGVYNDTLKIIMVGDSPEKSTLARALRNSGTKPRRRVGLGVDVHTWTHSQVKFSIWDVQGTSREDGSANAGAHPSTQSLFFSPNSLYILVWDLAAKNIKTRQRTLGTNDEEDDDDDDNEFILEEANRRADAALEADIYERVLAWVDCIPASNSAILPVVTVPESMNEIEVQRRCSMMQGMLMNHLHDKEPQLIFGNESILRVDLSHGVEELQATIVAIATDKRERIFDHVGSSVPLLTVDVLEIVRRLRQDHKVILLDHLLAEMNVISSSIQEVTASLHFLASIGELLYFGGTDKDDVLSRYIILSRKWLVSALSCILRNDLKRELSETRRFMNMQCAYSGRAFPENEILKTLLSGTNSSCPILSSTDSLMLWQNMSFMREAAERTSQLCEATNSSTMFEFLESLLVQKGIFLPLNVSQQEDPTPTYFAPSLLAQGEPSDVWTYKTSESWMTTLCHSWLLRAGAPANLMEHVSVSLIQDLYEFSHSIQPSFKRLEHSTSLPLAHRSMNAFLETHETVGRMKIRHINFWKSSVLVKIGCVFAEPDRGEIRESFAEIFISLVNPQSVHCVSSSSIGSGMTRLVICGKGPAGHHGRKLWKSGYGVVLDSIKASVAHLSNVDRQVVCPECLAHSHPSMASTWPWDDVRAAAQTGNAGVRCMRGHIVDTSLLCGTCQTTAQSALVPTAGPRVSKPVASLLESVVLVGLWDEQNQQIRNVGSGFIVDKKNGLIVTAGHILFTMAEGNTFGVPYFGLKHAKAVIGVIADDSHMAKFRYFAEIVAHDIANIDACVLRITSKMEQDVEGEGEDCGTQPEILLINDMEAIKAENLQQLKLTRSFELEETVRILGFNQGGEGLLEQGKHINRSADFAKGYICKKFKASWDDESSHVSDSSSSTCFCPREEIVVMCPTISGHSGGPCVNEDGRVVGILSRADPVDRQRCYLVPSSELRDLVKEAKGACRIGMSHWNMETL